MSVPDATAGFGSAGGMLLALKDLPDNSVVYYMADATCLAGA